MGFPSSSTSDADPDAPEQEPGERLGCGHCFWTLDPDDPGLPDRRRFVRCTAPGCDRLFHRGCWAGRCTRPGCSGTSCAPIAIARPRPLGREEGSDGPPQAGPINTIADVPLGISRGSLVFLDHRPKKLEIRNNTGGFLDLPPTLGPAWVSARYHPLSASEGGVPKRDLSGRVLLAPGKRIEVVVRPHRFRPSWRRCFVPLNERQGFEVVSDVRPIHYLGGLALMLGLVLVHWYRFVAAWASLNVVSVLWLSSSLGLLVAAGTMLTPSRVRRLASWALEKATAGRGAFPGSGWLRTARDDLLTGDFTTPDGDELARRAGLAATAALVATIGSFPIYWFAIALFKTLLSLASSRTALLAFGLSYGGLLAAAWHAWFRELRPDPLAPEGLAGWIGDQLEPGGWDRSSRTDRLLILSAVVLALVLLYVLYAMMGSLIVTNA